MRRWLRRQTSESVVSKLPEGLQMAIPAWRLEPLACQHVSAAPEPRLSVDALLALRDLRDQPPWLPSPSLALPGAPPLQGASDAHNSSISPPLTEPAPLREPHRVAAAARPPASPRSRAAHPTAHPGEARRGAPGASPGAPRGVRPICHAPPTSLCANPAAIKDAPIGRVNGGKTPWRSAPARWGARKS